MMELKLRFESENILELNDLICNTPHPPLWDGYSPERKREKERERERGRREEREDEEKERRKD
jgi:hypothetical protein